MVNEEAVPTFLWNPAWETGVAGIDEQHRELFHRMELLASHLSEGGDLHRADETLVYLTDYVELHFNEEEALMIQVDYPDFDLHHSIHKEMRSQLHLLIGSYQDDRDVLTFGLMNFLVSWLLDHINLYDRMFAGYLQGRPETLGF